jgi:hypothetical protein
MTDGQVWAWAMTIAVFGIGIGWHLSGIWRGTTKRGYLLALDHVQIEAAQRAGRPLIGVLRELRAECSPDGSKVDG